MRSFSRLVTLLQNTYPFCLAASLRHDLIQMGTYESRLYFST